jgi:hypothetical protein
MILRCGSTRVPQALICEIYFVINFTSAFQNARFKYSVVYGPRMGNAIVQSRALELPSAGTRRDELEQWCSVSARFNAS